MGTTVLSELLGSQGTVQRFGRLPVEKAKLDEYNAIKKALNEEAKANWDEPAWHREQAATLAAQYDYGFEFDNLFSSYVQTRNVGFTDKEYIRERRGLRAYWTHRGGYVDESQITTEDFEVPRDTIGFHVSEFDDKLQVGFADSMEAMAALGNARVEVELNRRVFTLLQEAIPSSSDYYVDATSGGLTKEVLDDSIRETWDAVRPDGIGPVPVTIIGRAALVDQISDLSTAPGTFDPAATEELRARGYVGSYRGAQIIRVRNYTDEDGVSFIPDNELWVVAGTVGTFVRYGGAKVREWLENTVDYRHYRMRQDVGGLIYHPEQARRVVTS